MKTPLELFGDLFIELHVNQICEDGKIISDAIPNSSPENILSAYQESKSDPDFDLANFFNTHFTLSKSPTSTFSFNPDANAEDHVFSLWPYLKRVPDTEEQFSSLISLPHEYIVPGGRFNEIYYWDSYFTMLGLAEHNQWATIRSMIDNFAFLIDKVGFIPNGNRSYFLGRSQPPFYSLMIELLANKQGPEIYSEYLTTLEKEYAFWMSKPDEHISNSAYKHLVFMDDLVLNRYYDHHMRAREEMYHDDYMLLQESGRSAEDLFSNLRAACESGWDFSSRWCEDLYDLKTIECSDIIPVDLNCLLYNLESVLAAAYKVAGDDVNYEKYHVIAEKRKRDIRHFFWNDEVNCFTDFNWVKNAHTDSITAACAYPLYFNICSDDQAKLCAFKIEEELMAPGGVLTTNIDSGQQWDSPNGWAPLQWITVIGLINYGFNDLALELTNRWVSLCERVYSNTGKFVEKYNVVDMELEAGGGEYDVQDGFGWSNGVYVALKKILKNES